MSIDVSDYIKFKTLEYKYYKLCNNDLWKQYKKDFIGFIKAIFKTYKGICDLWTLLCDQGVQIIRDRRITITQSLYNTLYKEDLIEQSKEEILDYIKAKGLFSSFKLNRLSSLITNLLN